jgi:hypothetical protein
MNHPPLQLAGKGYIQAVALFLGVVSVVMLDVWVDLGLLTLTFKRN